MGKKEAFAKKIEAQLDEWGAELQKLKAKANKADANAKLKYHKEIKKLERKQDEFRKNVKKLKQSGDQAWEELQAGIESGWSDLKKGAEELISRFK